MSPLTKHTSEEEQTYKSWATRALELSLIAAGAVFAGVLDTSLKEELPLSEAVRLSIIESIKWGLLFFVFLCPLFLLGQYVANKKFTAEQKEIIALIIWLLIIVTFLLPFVMVFVFGK